jgi:ABC-type molybdenum transport system ATPase subunit/photorepair protein PhrA
MTTTKRSALKVTGLRKSFGEKTVLDGIDFDIAEGTTFSLLGPNGAGKTTTVQNQPFTPITETPHGLLTGTPIGHSAILAVAWCAGITAVGYLWARARYDHNSAHQQ